MFKIGDLAVYPVYGVVIVKGIEVKEICGTKKTFYIFKAIDSDVTVMVPTDNTQTVGLRPIIPKTEIPKIYQILKNRKKTNNSCNGHKSWNKRYREYAEKLKSGNIVDVAEVLKDIYLLQNEKELSFGERRIMNAARTLLIKEISIARNLEEESIAGEVQKLLSE
ncbi:MAG TPA: CarD family transcriptional regulator [Thermodesulfobacteriota bacterium]|jgi:CarD family transcriptional regulator